MIPKDKFRVPLPELEGSAAAAHQVLP